MRKYVLLGKSTSVSKGIHGLVDKGGGGTGMGAERGIRRGGGRIRVKEIVFYNSFLYPFNIIEILIMKINFFLIYKLYTPLYKDKPGYISNYRLSYILRI